MASLVMQVMCELILLMLMVSTASAQTTCSTGTTSPTTADVNTCIQYLNGLNDNQNCCQTSYSSGSNACTTMCTSGTAVVEICGDYQSCTNCGNAANAINTILTTCNANVNDATVVSGTTTVGGFTFRIRHS